MSNTKGGVMLGTAENIIHVEYKILILISDTGGGHRSSAEALALAIQNLNSRVRIFIVDIFTDHGSWPFNIFVPAYKYLCEHPPFWRLLYTSTQASACRSLINTSGYTMCSAKFRELFKSIQPNLVCSIHPLCQHIPLKLLQTLYPGVKLDILDLYKQQQTREHLGNLFHQTHPSLENNGSLNRRKSSLCFGETTWTPKDTSVVPPGCEKEEKEVTRFDSVEDAKKSSVESNGLNDSIHSRPRIPFVTVITDLGEAHPFWFSKQVDLCFVASDEIKKAALSYGLIPTQVRQYGLPLRQPFWNVRKRSKAFTKKQLKLEPHTPMCLLVGGGDGVGNLQALVKSLVEAIQKSLYGVCDVQLVIVCGRNQELKESLERHFRKICTSCYDEATNNHLEGCFILTRDTVQGSQNRQQSSHISCQKNIPSYHSKKFGVSPVKSLSLTVPNFACPEGTSSLDDMLPGRCDSNFSPKKKDRSSRSFLFRSLRSRFMSQRVSQHPGRAVSLHVTTGEKKEPNGLRKTFIATSSPGFKARCCFQRRYSEPGFKCPINKSSVPNPGSIPTSCHAPEKFPSTQGDLVSSVSYSKLCHHEHHHGVAAQLDPSLLSESSLRRSLSEPEILQRDADSVEGTPWKIPFKTQYEDGMMTKRSSVKMSSDSFCSEATEEMESDQVTSPSSYSPLPASNPFLLTSNTLWNRNSTMSTNDLKKNMGAVDAAVESPTVLSASKNHINEESWMTSMHEWLSWSSWELISSLVKKSSSDYTAGEHQDKEQPRLHLMPRKKTSTRVIVKLLPFVSNIHTWMAAADILITKAGPGTIAEACVYGLPILIYFYLPGQEEGNVAFVTKHKIGAYSSSPAVIAYYIKRFLTSPTKRKEISIRARQLCNPNATLCMARDILDLLYYYQKAREKLPAQYNVGSQTDTLGHNKISNV